MLTAQQIWTQATSAVQAPLLLPRALGAVLDQVASRSRRKAARKLLEAMGPTRRRVMAMLWEVVKEAATSDPDMWDCVKAQVRTAVDEIAEDVDRQTEEHLMLSTCERPEDEQANPDPLMTRKASRSFRYCRCFCSLYLAIRRFVLHHLCPHNKTVWGSMKDTVWWIFNLLTLVTLGSVRCTVFGALLILLVFPGPADEYQLTKYVLVMKANQFFTTGLGCMMFGCCQYYFCIVFQKRELVSCISLTMPTPFSLWFCLLDFLGSFVLSMLAMAAFHRAQRLKPCALPPGFEREDVARDLLQCCGCCEVRHPAPMRLRLAIRYDSTCFVVSVALMVILTTVADHSLGDLLCEPLVDWPRSCRRDPTLLLNAYWCRVLYSLLMFPFILAWVPDFTPISFSLITRAIRTGYNEAGQCVLFRLSKPEGGDGRGGGALSEESGASSSEEDSAPARTHRLERVETDMTYPQRVPRRQKDARLCC